MERIKNVRIMDLIGVLYALSQECKVVDIIIDSKNRKVIFDPIRDEDSPSEDIIFTDDNIIDFI